MTVAVLLVALLSMVSFVSAVSPVMADSAPTGFPTAGDTIRINSEADLIAAKAAYGWNGTGTASNPIVIDGTKGDSQIDMAGSAVGLYIANITTLNIQIKNWTINNTADNGIGIEILNVRTAFSIHGVVVNNTKVGIYLNLTRSATVYECVLFNCETDVLVEKSISPVIRDNTMYFTGLTLATTRAVHLSSSLNGAIDNNKITEINNPILIEYCRVTTVGHNAVLNCTLGLFNNQGSVYTFIHNNTFENVGIRAVHLNFDGNNATLVDNVFKNVTSDAIFLTDDNDVLVKDNEFTNCSLGVGGNNNDLRLTIYHNVFIDCHVGVSLNETHEGSITYNAFLGSASYGVSLLYNATMMSVHHNVFKDCNSGGTPQAFDFVDDQNQWNDSSFGNYWNDHTAPGIHDTGVSDTPASP
jgi:nitrous oxidase accessory protein NosD